MVSFLAVWFLWWCFLKLPLTLKLKSKAHEWNGERNGGMVQGKSPKAIISVSSSACIMDFLMPKLNKRPSWIWMCLEHLDVHEPRGGTGKTLDRAMSNLGLMFPVGNRSLSRRFCQRHWSVKNPKPYLQYRLHTSWTRDPAGVICKRISA